VVTDLTEARALSRTDMRVKTLNGGQQSSGLTYCDAAFDFVYENFVRRFSLSNRKSKTKIHVRLANKRRVATSISCESSFELFHEFARPFCVLRDSHVASIVLGSPWLDDKQATIQIGTKRFFTLMDGSVRRWRSGGGPGGGCARMLVGTHPHLLVVGEWTPIVVQSVAR
jgi:hypothetical protein